MAKLETARRLLTRVNDNDGHLLHFRCDRVGARAGNSSTSFISKEHVPDFEGREACFELERVSAKPWPYWRATRQIEPPPV